MTSENAGHELNTIKGHGLSMGDRFDFYGMGSDAIPAAEGTRVAFMGKVGTKYMIGTVTGDVHTWEFGPSAKIWADTTVKHHITVSLRYLANGDVVYVGACEHGWETGFHTTEDDAYAVAEGHGDVSRPLYVAPVVLDASDVAEYNAQQWAEAGSPRDAKGAPIVPVEITGAEVETARVAVRDNGRVFAAEVHNFGGQGAFDTLADGGLLTLVEDGDMSRYIRTMRTSDGVVITDGMAVWDYNLNPGRVILSSVDRDGWFYVDTVNAGRSLMNAERVCVAHPRDGVTARAFVEGTKGSPGLGTIADNLVKADKRHAAALVAEVPPVGTRVLMISTGMVGTVEARYSDGRANVINSEGRSLGIARGVDLLPMSSVEIHTGDGTVITEDDVKARVRQAFGPRVEPGDIVRRVSDGSEGVVRDVVGMGMLDVMFPSGAGLVRTATELQAMGYVVIPAGDVPIEYPTNRDVDLMRAGVDPYAEITESEVWAGTGTMIKRPIRTKLGKRKRKASKVNARRVRGGF